MEKGRVNNRYNGKKTSRHETTSGVGNGSKAQDFFADD